jgi:protein-disulfide isomerase
VQSGKLRYAVLDFPLESLHSAAFRAAEIVGCAEEQGKYWEMRERLFANPQTVTQVSIHAVALGLDATRMDACLAARRPDPDIRKDMSVAAAVGVEGTPSFLLATTDSATGKLKPFRLIVGAQPFENFKKQIDAALAEQGGR